MKYLEYLAIVALLILTGMGMASVIVPDVPPAFDPAIGQDPSSFTPEVLQCRDSNGCWATITTGGVARRVKFGKGDEVNPSSGWIVEGDISDDRYTTRGWYRCGHQ